MSAVNRQPFTSTSAITALKGDNVSELVVEMCCLTDSVTAESLMQEHFCFKSDGPTLQTT